MRIVTSQPGFMGVVNQRHIMQRLVTVVIAGPQPNKEARQLTDNR